MTATSAVAAPNHRDVELSVGGMTCASCAARIERKLNRLDGVSATVNFATETARVCYAGGVSIDDLIGTVRATGYTAEVAAAAEPQVPPGVDATPEQATAEPQLASPE